MSEIEVTGVDHVYVTVTDLEASERFYDPLMKRFGFKKSSGPLAGGDRHVHYFNRVTQYTIRPASADGEHDRRSPGLNHLCFRVADEAAVDSVATVLTELGVERSEPRLYPEYAPDYYAVFFHDPDGICLEIVNHRGGRKKIAEEWDSVPWSQSSPTER